ncbi:MAG: hypothetical protein WCF67_24930 [Chitinophagaceae bacterium]
MKDFETKTMLNNLTAANIYECILELSDSALQRKLWLNEDNDTGLMSSYVELYCTLFNDNNFDDFIDHGAPETRMPPELIHELNVLRELLNNYKGEERKNQQEIIEDPEWKKIGVQAREVLKHWGK